MFVNLNAESSAPKVTPAKNTKVIGTDAPPLSKAEALKELVRRFSRVDEVFRELPDMSRSEVLRILGEALPALKRTYSAFSRAKIKEFKSYLTHSMGEVEYLRNAVIKGDTDDLSYPCIQDALSYFREQWAIEDPQPGQFKFDVSDSGLHESVKIGSVVAVDLPAFQYKRKFAQAEFNTMDVHGYLGFNAQYLIEFSARAASQGRAAGMISELLDGLLSDHRKVFGLVSEHPYCYEGKAYYWIMPRNEIKRFVKVLNHEVGIHKWGTLNADIHEQLSGAPHDDSTLAADDEYVDAAPEVYEEPQPINFDVSAML